MNDFSPTDRELEALKVLLTTVLDAGKLIAQPVRRMAVHWPAAAGLLFLALLCTVPGWSVVHMLSAPAEPLPVWTKNLEPLAGPVIQTAQLPPQPVPDLSPVFSNTPEVTTTTVAATHQITVIDYGVLSLYLVAAGSIAILLWLAIGSWQVRRLRRFAGPAPGELCDLMTKLSPPSRPIPMLGIVKRLPVAAAVGLRRPMVLLSQSSLDLASLEKLRMVLAHELAHIHHRDLWLLALLCCLMLMLWLHPLYWL